LKSTRAKRSSISRPEKPPAMRAPIREPALVPTTPSTGRPTSSRRWMAPMWATPRAPPPERASATRGRPGTSTWGAKVKIMSGWTTLTSIQGAGAVGAGAVGAGAVGAATWAPKGGDTWAPKGAKATAAISPARGRRAGDP